MAPPGQLVLTRGEVEAAAPPLAEIVRIVEDAYRMDGRGEAEVPVKIGVHPDRPHSFLEAMPAWVSGARALGLKWISYFPGNAAGGLPDSSGVIVLNDPAHGLPVAIMDGMWITFVRTAACGAVAARYCARPEPESLGLVGCGGLGHWTLRVFAEAFPSLCRVRVASRTAASRARFCRERAGGGDRWDLRPVERLEQAVRGMDVIVSSIPQGTVRPLAGAWWEEGATAVPLDVLAAWDDEAFALSDRLVTDGQERLETLARRRRPTLALPDDRASLAELALGRTAGRRSPAERIMAIPTGVASTDMALAWEIYRRARAAGLGREIDLSS